MMLILRSALLLLLVSLALSKTSVAQTEKPTIKKPADGARATKVRDLRSKNFLVHTDLGDAEANALLTRLETMLKLISQYWGRPNPKLIECFVVDDLANWPEGAIDPRGLKSIQDRAGVTLTSTSWQGTRLLSATSTVFATGSRGCPQHEVVHAYCGQVFGRTGPLWYSEGMAELGAYWKENDPSTNCPPETVKFIRGSEPKTLNAIVNAKEITGDSWENYQWRWALCHLLANNPNYAPRFRPLGLGMLTGQQVSFESVYGNMAQEISFEYLFFLKHFEVGYRADLCGWDWKAKFKPLAASGSYSNKIKAKGGWQPTFCLVKSGASYEYTAEGKWRVSKSAAEVDANGADDGQGKLVGAIFNPQDYELGEPFELSAGGEWQAPADGQLVVRCQQPWREINDEDSGQVTFKIRLKASARLSALTFPIGKTD